MAIGLAGLGLAGPAFAASFDCGKAKSPREKVICGDPVLSLTDSDLDAVYRKVLAGLSEQAQRAIRDGQRSWLHYLDVVCPAPIDASNETREACLRNQYQERIDNLKTTISEIAGYTFYRVEKYSAVVSGDDAKEIDQHRATCPRIDRPMNANAQAFNRFISCDLRSSDRGDGDTDETYNISLFTKYFVSVTWDDGYYGHGAAHGDSTTKVQNIAFAPKPHVMSIGEIFRPDSHWRSRLTKIAEKQVKAAAEESDLKDVSPEDVDNAAGDPSRWRMTPKGIELDLQLYEVGPYIFNPEVNITWQTLRNILKPGLGLPPEASN